MRCRIATWTFIANIVLAAGCRSTEGTARAPHPQPALAPTVVAIAATGDAAIDAAEVGSDTGTGDVGAGAVALPKKCAAESPVDQPCASYGGTYRVRITPRASESEHCVVTKAVEADVTIDGSATYDGKGQAAELEALAKALGMKKADLRVGAALREGVCCVDLRIDEGKDVERSVRLHIARGATTANAKAKERRVAGSKMCDAELDVSVTLTK